MSASFVIGAVRVTSFGVTTLLFDDGETQLLFDAMVTRPSLTDCLLKKIDSDYVLVRELVKEHDMSRLKGIFISHTHYDHVLDAPAFARETGADVYASRSGVNVALGNGILKERTHIFAGGENYKIGGFTVKIIPSIHSKATILNNDLGIEIEKPVTLPAKKGLFTEGGSYDFYVEYEKKTQEKNGKNAKQSFLIRPSCNYLEGSLAGMQADVLFQGIARLSKMSASEKERFYRETVQTVQPHLVIPIHWDNFFKPYENKNETLYRWMDDIRGGMQYLTDRLKNDGVYWKVLK